MRLWVIAGCVTLSACASSSGASSSGASQLFAVNGDTAFTAGRWGEAMAAYDAAHNEAPTDGAISLRRRDAAAKWVEAMAPALAKETPPEKAFALLNALAAEGNKRGATAEVERSVVPALDGAVARVWNGDEASEDPKVLWQAISRGENLTQTLPESSAARTKLAALRKRGSAVFARLAGEAKNPSTVWLYRAMAARMSNEQPAGEFVKAMEAATAFDYQVAVAAPSCPKVADEVRKRLAFFKSFDAHGVGQKVQVDVKVECLPLPPPKTRQELRSWVEKHVDSLTIPGSCTQRKNITAGGSVSLVKKDTMGGGQATYLVSTPPTYSTVPDCDPPRTYTSERAEARSDLVTITTQEVGVNAAGEASMSINGKTYLMPLSSRVVAEKTTTEGAVFGRTVEEAASLVEFHEAVAHGLWLELTFLSERAHTAYGVELLARAEGQQADGRLGDAVSAVRAQQLVSKDSAKYFADLVGLDEHEVKELVLKAPRVMASVNTGGNYKLEVPKVDANVARVAEEKKQAAGEDAFK